MHTDAVKYIATQEMHARQMLIQSNPSLEINPDRVTKR